MLLDILLAHPSNCLELILAMQQQKFTYQLLFSAPPCPAHAWRVALCFCHCSAAVSFEGPAKKGTD